MKVLCEIDENSDVKVVENNISAYQVYLTRKRWPNTYNLKDLLETLQLIREAGYRVPEEVTKYLALKLVNKIFNDDSL